MPEPRMIARTAPIARTKPCPLTFVIPVLNGERFIGRCLAHLRLEARAGDEVLVVDNGSTDRTRELAVADGATLIEAPGVSIAALRNLGAARARHAVLAFVDADCLICPGWRAAVERILTDPEVAATGSFYDLPEAPTWVERAWWSFRPRHEHRANFLISGNFVVRRTSFDAVGGFDPSLVTDEDSDISRRLVDSGAVLVEAPSVRVIHLGNAKTLAQFFHKERWHATSVLATMRAHGVDRSMAMTFTFMGLTLSAILTLVLGPPHPRTVIAALLLIAAAPGATATLKVLRYRNYRFLPELVLLNLVVLTVRSLTVLEAALPRGPAR